MSRYSKGALFATVTFHTVDTLDQDDVKKTTTNFRETIKIIKGDFVYAGYFQQSRRFKITLRYPAHRSISSIVSTLKGRSARMLGRKWEREYEVVSVEGSEGVHNE